MRESIHSTSRQGTVRCPYCREEFLSVEDGIECTSCGARHHPGCFEEHGACSTHACGSQAAEAVNNPDDSLAARVQMASDWGASGSSLEGLRWFR